MSSNKKTKQRQQYRGEAFNSIMKIYHPKATVHYDNYPDSGSYSEQRDYKVREIIELYLKRLNKINNNEQ